MAPHASEPDPPENSPSTPGLRATVRAVAAVALVTAIGAFLDGPSRAAVMVRRACVTGIGAVRGATSAEGRLGPVVLAGTPGPGRRDS